MDNICYWGEILEIFDEVVFDNVEVSIKYFVLINIWFKFVKERRLLDLLEVFEFGL